MDRDGEGSTAVAEHEETQAGTDQQQEQHNNAAAPEAVADELARLKNRQERENECVTKIFNIRMEISKKEATIEKEKGAKKELEGELNAELHRLCEIVRGQGDTLFDGVENKPEAPAAAAPAPEDDDAWRSVALADIGIDAKLLEKLAAKDITTLGHVADFTAAGRDKLTDIEGIGPASAEKIENAIETYWVNHPRKAAEPAGTEAAGNILAPFDIGLNVEDIAPKAFPDLLKEAEKGNEPKVELIEVERDADIVELFVNVGGLNPETGEVEALQHEGKPVHRLLPLYTPDEFKEAFSDDQPNHEDDKLIGTRVKVGRKAYVVGSREDSILVLVSE